MLLYTNQKMYHGIKIGKAYKMELTLGKTRAYLNGSSKTLNVEPRTINGRTMLPIRFISENFGCDVEWDGSTQTVTIKY